VRDELVEVREEPLDALEDYARISIAFEVHSRVRVHPPDAVARTATGEWCVEPVDPPWRKDYDAAPGHHPTAWRMMLPSSCGQVLAARAEGARVGGGIVLCAASDIDLLEGRSDVALLWDLRVDPGWRGRGVGTALFHAAARWGLEHGCLELLVETQDINVPACRFYARQGCRLSACRRHAYVECPHEIQLLWRLDLRAAAFAPVYAL